ncbi:hypothetical protein C5L14_08425 [Labrys okinawensis]|uniref:Uncharacterized protein n=1 Tax=Labrys okinawensis TaxID=346911 RepID=A0A2S9QF03_9HYPH|nr:DUF6111 family protein [Labrys okinawensis]PRH87927.1 hypothetical protein C5L14_08425 [Labrys okinawensis]
MFRPFLFEAVLFILPFLVYGAWVLLRGKRPGLPERTGMPLLRLIALGVICMAVGLALFAHYGGAPAGSGYTPAHMENGKLIQPETR